MTTADALTPEDREEIAVLRRVLEKDAGWASTALGSVKNLFGRKAVGAAATEAVTHTAPAAVKGGFRVGW